MSRRPVSDEAKAKMAESARNRDPSTRRGVAWSEERKQAQSARVKGTRYSPELKARMSELKKQYWAKKRAEKNNTNSAD